jgi:hypothetical protein
MAENERATEAILRPIGVGFCASILLAVISLLCAGAGHGTYIPMILCFPYTMLFAAARGSINAPDIATALLQFPIYGTVLGIARSKGVSGRFCAILGALHLAAVGVALAVAAKRGNFFP